MILYMLISLVYRSPNSNNDKLLQLLQDLPYVHSHTHLLLMGDFNFPNINLIGVTTLCLVVLVA